MNVILRAASLASLLALSVRSFSPQRPLSSPATVTQAFWRHWIPETDQGIVAAPRSEIRQTFQPAHLEVLENAKLAFFGSCLLSVTLLLAQPSWAVSGGGLDFAGLDISGQDFSKSDYKGKDFTQVIAKGTNFANSNLQGCRFYKAYLVNVDFSGADIRGASLEDTSMDGAFLKDTVAVGSYFSKSILDVATLENADFTDAQFPSKTLPLLCERDDLTGTNPVTGADTRDSAMCP